MDVANDVKQIIAKELKIPVEQLGDDVKLADIGAESLDVIEIVFNLEEKFNVDISIKTAAAPSTDAAKAQGPTDLNDFATVGDICRAVQALVDAKAAK
jgi:acyl carrier protein